MQFSLKKVSSMTPTVVIAVASAGILLTGWIDYATGVEIRVLPLYYLPLALAAWDLGRRGAVAAAVACAIAWLVSNFLAGLHYSSTSIWAINLVMQGTSFLVVGLLIASVRKSYLEAQEISRTDSLTLLLNARAFADEAGRVLALSRRHRHPITLAYIDLDNFKAVNDSFGHDKGDEVLRSAADLLRRMLRGGDVIARIGGDEFVVLLPETGPDGARPLIERVRETFANTLRIGAQTVTASIGAISFVEPPPNIEDLMRRADALMYSAKSGGKNQTKIEAVSAAVE
jgi:diguanylate cyclase (GGDEF)-like protein